MSLLRTASHMAVASAVHGRVQRRQSQKWAARRQAAAQPIVADAPQPTPSAAVPAQPATASAVDPAQRIALLQQLGELRAAGVLTDAEFEQQKAQLLA